MSNKITSHTGSCRINEVLNMIKYGNGEISKCDSREQKRALLFNLYKLNAELCELSLKNKMLRDFIRNVDELIKLTAPDKENTKIERIGK